MQPKPVCTRTYVYSRIMLLRVATDSVAVDVGRWAPGDEYRQTRHFFRSLAC